MSTDELMQLSESITRTAHGLHESVKALHYQAEALRARAGQTANDTEQEKASRAAYEVAESYAVLAQKQCEQLKMAMSSGLRGSGGS